MDPIQVEEEQKLKEVEKKLEQARDALVVDIEKLGGENLDALRSYRESPETSPLDVLLFMEQLHEKNISFNLPDKFKRLEELENLLKEPYFSRIDLEDINNKQLQKIYIGKFGFTDKEPVITDWRAKIASVYYRYRFPQKNVSYITPDGLETRDLTLKRTFEIDKGQLIKYYNNDLKLDENEIIAGKIEQRTGGVLEDIVETIQIGQLDIIESDPRQICIVQGCVGSGKSTVAIHKLSHIFFNYPELIHPERSILIAKNQILVGYLSTLFPKLGIFNINYKTLRDLVYNAVFRERLKISMDFNLGDTRPEVDLKTINKLRKKVKEIHSKYDTRIQKIFSDEEFESFGGFVYDHDQSAQENLIEIVADLNEELESQKEYFKENPESINAWLYQSNITDLRKLISKIRNLGKEMEENDFPELLELAELNVKEDLSYKDTLLYMFLYSQIFGFQNTQKFEYCVVDEAQDLTLLEYSVLSKFVLKGRLCILGDLNQSIKEEGLSKWDEIYEVVTEAKNANIFELDTNYRSTKQIIDLANNILGSYTQKYLPKSINRLGPDPIIKQFSGIEEMMASFEAEIGEDLKNLDKSVGVICFDSQSFDIANEFLKNIKTEEEIIVLDENKPIHYIPKGVYLTTFDNCKGLEFSKVYVLNLNLNKVSSFLDAKKAFVAVTRAMNELEVYAIK